MPTQFLKKKSRYIRGFPGSKHLRSRAWSDRYGKLVLLVMIGNGRVLDRALLDLIGQLDFGQHSVPPRNWLIGSHRHLTPPGEV